MTGSREIAGTDPGAASGCSLPADDIAFTYRHAMDFACPDTDQDRARAYARWYVDQFAYSAESMEDLPSHSFAWPRFLESAA